MKNKLIPVALLFVSIFSLAVASEESAESVQQSSEKQLVVALPTDPEGRWSQYLDSHGMLEGLNEKGDYQFFIASGTVRVGKPFGNGWVASRNAAFEKAVLLAKSELADFVRSEIDSSRSVKFLSQGAEIAPELVDATAVVKKLSVIGKVEALTHEVLDEILRKYNPDWNGSGISLEEKQRKVVFQREQFMRELGTKARLFLQGASPIFNAEGPNDRGEYSVTVGMLWSPRLANIAESLYNPTAINPVGEPGKPIHARITEMLANDPSALAAFQGIRVWRDQNGNPVLVSVASVDRIGSDAIARKMTSLKARGQLATFISESITSNGIISGGESIDNYMDGSTRAFNEERFVAEINARSKSVPISGAKRIYTWKGEHPIARMPMYVGVFSWSRKDIDLANQFRILNKRGPKEYLKDDSGTVGKKQTDQVASSGMSGPGASYGDF